MSRITVVTPKEHDDFFEGVRSCGHNPHNFRLGAREAEPIGRGPIMRFVTVERMPMVMEYLEQPGESWITKALDSVRNGVFGKK